MCINALYNLTQWNNHETDNQISVPQGGTGNFSVWFRINLTSCWIKQLELLTTHNHLVLMFQKYISIMSISNYYSIYLQFKLCNECHAILDENWDCHKPESSKYFRMTKCIHTTICRVHICLEAFIPYRCNFTNGYINIKQ
jgi:hypothetical protein